MTWPTASPIASLPCSGWRVRRVAATIFRENSGLFLKQCESSTASGNWAKIVVRLDEQNHRLQQWRCPRSIGHSAPLIVASLIVAVTIGYSTDILKMPCCTSSAPFCVSEDGLGFLVFEHNEEQPMWFGDSPAISARGCGRICHCAQMFDQLAVTWKVGT